MRWMSRLLREAVPGATSTAEAADLWSEVQKCCIMVAQHRSEPGDKIVLCQVAKLIQTAWDWKGPLAADQDRIFIDCHLPPDVDDQASLMQSPDGFLQISGTACSGLCTLVPHMREGAMPETEHFEHAADLIRATSEQVERSFLVDILSQDITV